MAPALTARGRPPSHPRHHIHQQSHAGDDPTHHLAACRARTPRAGAARCRKPLPRRVHDTVPHRRRHSCRTCIGSARRIACRLCILPRVDNRRFLPERAAHLCPRGRDARQFPSRTRQQLHHIAGHQRDVYLSQLRPARRPCAPPRTRMAHRLAHTPHDAHVRLRSVHQHPLPLLLTLLRPRGHFHTPARRNFPDKRQDHNRLSRKRREHFRIRKRH